MEKRGFKTGLEHRWVGDDRTRGAAMMDFLDDRETDGGTPDETRKWGYGDDGAPRANHDRYWLRMKQELGAWPGFTAGSTLDIVSDRDFIHEFKDDPSGFNGNRGWFEKTSAGASTTKTIPRGSIGSISGEAGPASHGAPWRGGMTTRSPGGKEKTTPW